MSTEVRPAHSPLGASSAERWMNCPGSVALLKALDLPPSDEEDWRREGVAAHEAIAHCFTAGLEAWEVIGLKFHNTEITVEIADAIGAFLGLSREWEEPGCIYYTEFGIDAPDFHKYFYGTLDRGIVLPIKKTLVVNDYKNGAGVVVEVTENPQIMYYAYGLLRHHPEVEQVVLNICQPNAFHPEGAVRTWTTTATFIREWAERELLSAMHRTELDDTLDPGPWCRFCPAKLVCPAMVSLFGASMTADPKLTVNLSDASLGRSYQYVQAVTSYLKAMEAEVFRRLNINRAVPGTKLVQKKANRVFKAGALAVFEEKFGADAYTKPELKSPPEM